MNNELKEYNASPLDMKWMTLPVKNPHRKKFWVK